MEGQKEREKTGFHEEKNGKEGERRKIWREKEEKSRGRKKNLEGEK